MDIKIANRSVDVDMEQMEVSSSDSSDRKVEEAFGGQDAGLMYDCQPTTTTIGAVLLDVNLACLE